MDRQRSASPARVPARFAWAVQTLAVEPDDTVLEIGCGTGVAAHLIAAQLTTGHLVAIDQSAKMAQQARARLADMPVSRVSVQQVALAAADFGAQRFDKVFAFNVNVFWTKAAAQAEAFHSLRRCLKPGGQAYVFYQLPGRAMDRAFLKRLASSFAQHGFDQICEVTNAAADVRSLGLIARSR